MRRFLTAAFLVAIVGTSGACAAADDTTTAPSASAGTSSAATVPSTAATPSVDVAANTKEICAKSEAVITEADLTKVGQQIRAVIEARQQKNADAEAKAKTAIRAQIDLWNKQLSPLQAQAADPALKTAMGTLITALNTLGKDEYLAGFKSVADAAKLEATLTTATDAMTKVCG
jgi:hypothetical protein